MAVRALNTHGASLFDNAMNIKKKSAIYAKAMINRRRAAGLCPRCGNENDRDGYYCNTCLERKRGEANEARRFAKSLGLCPRCMKASLMPGQKACPECNAVDAVRKYIRRHTDQGYRERANARSEAAQRRLRERRKKDGMCPQCGKRKPRDGKVMCEMCLAKKREYKRIRRYKERDDSLCRCGKPLKDGYKVCQECYDKLVKQQENPKFKEMQKEMGRRFYPAIEKCKDRKEAQ